MTDEINYLLRRAQQETIEAIRSIHPSAAERHAEMAEVYSERARTLLARSGSERQAA